MRRPARTPINIHKRAKTLQRAGSGPRGCVSVSGCQASAHDCARRRACGLAWRVAPPWASADPDNQPITGNAEEAFASSRTDPTAGDDVLVGLAFSGGGTRAAAFAHGVLQEIDQTTVRTRTGTHSLLDSVGFVSGVSGGAVTAAYYGLKKRAALADFREKFLIRNAEEGLDTSVGPLSLVKALGGGVNDVKVFSRWLNENLFEGATFADFRKTPGPRVWINASDIYNRTPFIYGEATFIALCSNLATYPIADAVAASAAVPIVFTPMVIKTYPGGCTDKPPEWLEKAHTQSQHARRC